MCVSNLNFVSYKLLWCTLMNSSDDDNDENENEDGDSGLIIVQFSASCCLAFIYLLLAAVIQYIDSVSSSCVNSWCVILILIL